MSKCLSVFEQITWYASRTTALQRSTDWKYPSIDFNFWVMYGSWSFCDDCGSYWFNDDYFRHRVYQDQDCGETPDALAAFRREVPTDPLDHDAAGVVGYSSRWWYRSGMHKPVAYCSHCTRPTPGLSSGARFAEALRERHSAAQERAENDGIAGPVERTGQLYRIPRIRTAACREKPWSQECVTWPRYQHGRYSFANAEGESLLELSVEEARALQIVLLETNVKKERFALRAPSHHLNWKKVGLSRAYFRKDRIQESSMPTAKAKAAFRFLMEHNRFYKIAQEQQGRLLANGSSLNVRVKGYS